MSERVDNAARGGAAGAVEAPVRPCRVLGVVGEPLTGVSYVRFVQPFDRLRSLGFELVTLGHELTLSRSAGRYVPSPQLLDDVQLLIFPQLVTSPVMPDGNRVELVEPLCDEAARRGIKIVYSVDDYLYSIERQNPSYEVIQESLGNLERLLERADAIIVTTEQLARSLAEHGKPIHLLPNVVDPAHWKRRPQRPGPVRIGWSGSSSHLDDLLMLLPAIRELQQRLDFHFVLHGLCDLTLDQQARQISRNRKSFSRSQTETADRFVELLGLLVSLRFEHLPFGAMRDFFERLPGLDLDIGLCPLVDSHFNRHKSANKFYEYAVTGSLTVASDVIPYKDEVSVTASNDVQAWTATLERFVRDEKARQAEAERQREWVLAERNIEHWQHRWAEVLRRIIDGEQRPEE